jgi:transcriptional regulator with XRE-family HTH domain
MRLAAGFSEAELAAKVGMGRTTLRYWEPKAKRPNAALVQRAADALGVDPRRLVDGVPR